MGWPLYRTVQKGPRLAGLSAFQLLVILFSGFLGFFIVKLIFGLFVGLIWGVFHVIAYAILFFVGTQDPMFLPRFLLMFVGKFYKKLTSYESSKKTWTLIEK